MAEISEGLGSALKGDFNAIKGRLAAVVSNFGDKLTAIQRQDIVDAENRAKIGLSRLVGVTIIPDTSPPPPSTNVAPVITKQPANVTVSAGSVATFSASASGTPSPTVQWYISTNSGAAWTSVLGATSPTLTLGTSTTSQNGYQYRAVFTNSAGNTTTNSVILKVNAIVSPPSTSSPDHVVVVLFENQDRSTTLSQPYFASLAAQGVDYTNDLGKTHPSLPNYLELACGSTLGTDGSDTLISSNSDNIFRQMIAKGLSVKVYAENLPSDPTQDSGEYAARHNPAACFTNPSPALVCTDFSNFPTDYTQLPKLSFITPNLIDDMHDSNASTGDTWCKTHLDSYVQWAKTHNSVLIVWMDENSGNGLTTPVMSIIVGQGIAASKQNTTVNHASVLRVLESWFGLPYLNDAATAPDLPGLPASWGGIVNPPTSPPPSGANPSGIAPPSTISGWKQVFVDDFNYTVPLGSFPSAVQSSWGNTYPDGWQDTSKAGTYMPSQVVSIGNSVMNLHLHTNSSGVHCVCAPVPTIPASTSGGGGLLYGRYDICAKADSAIAGYKTAWLLWPDSETWPQDGEIDFPEAGIGNTVNAYMHHQNGTSGGDQDAYEGIGPSGGLASGWHVYTTIWTATSCQFLIDGIVYGTSTSRIPNTPMHYVIQTETDGGAPSSSVSGNIEIDWVAVYIPQ